MYRNNLISPPYNSSPIVVGSFPSPQNFSPRSECGISPRPNHWNCSQKHWTKFDSPYSKSNNGYRSRDPWDNRRSWNQNDSRSPKSSNSDCGNPYAKSPNWSRPNLRGYESFSSPISDRRTSKSWMSPADDDRNPGASRDIRDYASPEMTSDPWAELIARAGKS